MERWFPIAVFVAAVPASSCELDKHASTTAALELPDCERSGALCLPLDPNGVQSACPSGLVELARSCPSDQVASACCGFADQPAPEPERVDACAAIGGVWWSSSCPEGLRSTDVPSAPDGSVCCTFVEEAPRPLGARCPSKRDPSVRYFGETAEICEAIEYLCPAGGTAFVSPCGCGCVEIPAATSASIIHQLP